jgi:hypothetical protein
MSGCRYAQWRYAECRYAECHCAECRLFQLNLKMDRFTLVKEFAGLHYKTSLQC